MFRILTILAALHIAPTEARSDDSTPGPGMANAIVVCPAMGEMAGRIMAERQKGALMSATLVKFHVTDNAYAQRETQRIISLAYRFQAHPYADLRKDTIERFQTEIEAQCFRSFID